MNVCELTDHVSQHTDLFDLDLDHTAVGDVALVAGLRRRDRAGEDQVARRQRDVEAEIVDQLPRVVDHLAGAPEGHHVLVDADLDAEIGAIQIRVRYRV